MQNYQNNPNSLQKKKKKTQKNLNQAARYSGIAFEMLFIILAGVLGGIKLDEKLNSTPALTVVGSLLGVGMAMYFVLKDLLKKP